MSKTTTGLEANLTTNTGWVLALLLVAGSSFLLGSSYRDKPSAVVAEESRVPATQASVIGDITSSLQAGPPPVDTSVVTSTTASTPPTSKPTSAVVGVVNINSATQAELETLPGIGPSKAKAIIDYRTQNGPFITIEGIEKVKGIGPKTFESLKSKITI